MVTVIKKGEIVGLALSDLGLLDEFYDYCARGCFNMVILTTRLSHEFLVERVPNLGAKHVFFIDCISKEKDSQCILVPGIMSLTDMAIAVSKLLKNKEVKLLLVDSLSSLLVYNEVNTVLRFAKDISSKARSVGCTTIFPFIEEDSRGPLSSLKLYVDRFEVFSSNSVKGLYLDYAKLHSKR